MEDKTIKWPGGVWHCAFGKCVYNDLSDEQKIRARQGPTREDYDATYEWIESLRHIMVIALEPGADGGPASTHWFFLDDPGDAMRWSGRILDRASCVINDPLYSMVILTARVMPELSNDDITNKVVNPDQIWDAYRADGWIVGLPKCVEIKC